MNLFRHPVLGEQVLRHHTEPKGEAMLHDEQNAVTSTCRKKDGASSSAAAQGQAHAADLHSGDDCLDGYLWLLPQTLLLQETRRTKTRHQSFGSAMKPVMQTQQSFSKRSP